MAQDKEVNVNKVNYSVYQALAKAVFQDYSNSFNRMNPGRKVAFDVTLTPATVHTYDVLVRQGKFKDAQACKDANIKNDAIEVRYLRVGKHFEKITYHPAIMEEFKPGFIYQRFDVVDEVWDELQFEEGDTPPTQDILDDDTKVRVEKRIREREIPIYQQSIMLKNAKEVLNDKWWKRILYLDLINTLMAKGVEYGEALELIRRGEEEKAVLAKELGESAQQVLEANKIVIRKEMPQPLTEEDEKYKATMAKARDDDKKDSK